MGKQLDAIASTHLAEEMALRGIKVLFHTALVELAGTKKLESVRVEADGERVIAADFFVFATGILPNKELAGAAQLDCDKGILVDEFLRTSDESIFAIGECAQHGDFLAGTTAGAEAQARVLAEFLRGNEHSPFKPMASANILKMSGLSLAAAGITDPPAGDDSFEIITLHDASRRFYQKCVIQRDRLVGAICLGNTERFPKFLELIQAGLELETEREELLSGQSTRAPLDGRLICSCNQVGAGTIEKSARENECDMARVCAATRAGSGCGSCRPEVAAILAKVRAMLLLVARGTFVAPERMAESVQPGG